MAKLSAKTIAAPPSEQIQKQTGLAAPPRQSLDTRTEVLSRLELPEPIELLTPSGKLSKPFVTLVTTLHQQLTDAIPASPGRAPGKSRDKQNDCWRESRGGVPSSAEGLAQWFEQLPDTIGRLDQFTRAFAVEVFTLAAEIKKNEGIFEGRKLFDHQCGLLTWFGMALISPGRFSEPNRTFLLDSPHGSGKTQVLGLINLASLRTYARTNSPQLTSYVTSRGFSSSQQVVGLEQVRRIATHSYPEQITINDLKEMLRYVRSTMPLASERLPWSALGPLVQSHPNGFTTPAAARKEIGRLLGNESLTDLSEAGSRQMERALDELSLWFSHQGALVKADDQGKMMLLNFPPADEAALTTGDSPIRYAGDMVRGFPAEVVSSGLIFSRRFQDSLVEKQLKESPELVDAEYIARNCTTAVFCENEVQHGKRRTELVDSILSMTGLLIVDEGGRRSGYQLQNLIPNAAETKPIMIAATYSFSRVMPLGFLSLSYDAISPVPDINRAFSQGILPAVAERIYPAINEAHYPFSSKEAQRQIIDAHFEQIELYRTLQLPQPYSGRTILVVPKSATVDITIALQAEYEKRKIPGTVLPLSINAGSKDLERFTNRALAWMIAWKDRELSGNQTAGAQVLVTHPSAIIDGLDLPDVNVTLADPSALSRDKMMRLLMRACRGHDPQQPNSAYRGLITLHRFAPESETTQTFTHTPASLLDPTFDLATARNSGRTAHIRGAVVVPSKLVQQEQASARSKGIETVEVPFAAQGIRLLEIENGTPLPERVKEPRSARTPQEQPASVRPVSIVGAPLVAPNTEAQNLAIFSANLDRSWGRVEDLNHGCVIAEGALPETWKRLWQQNGQTLRPQIRSFAFILSSQMNIFDRSFGEQIGHHMLLSLGLIK